MSCNTCPLLESCFTNMELERESGLKAAEQRYENVQDNRGLEWETLAEEAMDRLVHILDKSAYSVWLNRDQLNRDEAGCPGPKDVDRLRIFGKTALVCSSQRRINIAEDYKQRPDGS